ncbi:hypothetical protein FACS189472_01460 [Alphaproteobacteria bacterium]|nr:hypothetical protein FACS189472_01460 [Alphaproteobacteria bacterium]
MKRILLAGLLAFLVHDSCCEAGNHKQSKRYVRYPGKTTNLRGKGYTPQGHKIGKRKHKKRAENGSNKFNGGRKGKGKRGQSPYNNVGNQARNMSGSGNGNSRREGNESKHRKKKDAENGKNRDENVTSTSNGQGSSARAGNNSGSGSGNGSGSSAGSNSGDNGGTHLVQPPFDDSIPEVGPPETTVTTTNHTTQSLQGAPK